MKYVDKAKAFFRGFVSGLWLVTIVNQMITTAGNIAESAFLLATLWVLINIAGHTLITWIVSAHNIELINNLCSIAFAALPELLFLAVIKTCIGHALTAVKRRDRVATTWAILYGIPTVAFGVITVYILSIASTYGLQSAIDMGGHWLIIRYLSGLFYAIIHSIDTSFARPHFASKMDEKDAEIARLKQEIEENLTSYSIEVETLTNHLKASTLQVNKLAEKASSLDRDVYALYPKVQSEWIEKAVKTVTLSEIEAVTGLSRQKVNGAIRSGKLRNATRNKELYTVSSVIEWLKTLPVIESSNGHHKDVDTDPLGLPVLSV